MIRIILIATIIISSVTVKAQSPLSFGGMNTIQPGFRQMTDTSLLQKKWFITKYAGISAGLMTNNGAHGSFLSAPMGVQLNRQLTNNVLAFAGVSVAPSYFPLSYSLYQPGINKYNTFMTPNSFGTYTTAQMGLMYINNERTFSISGSIGVGRSDFFGRSPYFNPANPPGIKNYKQ